MLAKQLRNDKLPWIYLIIQGAYLSENGTTGAAALTPSVSGSNTAVVTIAGISKKTAITVLAFLDLLSTLGFFVFSITFIVWIHRIAAKADEETITIKDYSVKVVGLPEDVGADEVKQYCERRWGAVARVDLARRCHKVICQLRKGDVLIAREERKLAQQQMAVSLLASPSDTPHKSHLEREATLTRLRSGTLLLSR